MKLEFDPIADAVYLEISSTEVETTKEIEPGIVVDYDKEGYIVGIEILFVSKRGISKPITDKTDRDVFATNQPM